MFWLANIALVNQWFMLANKKALRKRASDSRLRAHRERRNEELINGWLPLPWFVALIEFRVTAAQTDTDLSRIFFSFRDVSVQELRGAIGEKVLAYLEQDDEEPVVFNEGIRRPAARALRWRC